MTMIEWIARAIADADQEDYMEDCIIYDKRARAALTAMREPTAAMVAAANRNNHPRDIDTWRTMIDAAQFPDGDPT